MTSLLPYVEARLRAPAPPGAPVVPGSTPVLAFGDPSAASLATLGLNPSRVEFLDDRQGPLVGDQRRLVDLPQLGVESLVGATEGQLRRVVEGCDGYFGNRPYWRWFRPLDELLRSAFDATYTDGSACHLDLSQWATDPVWSKLDAHQRQVLIDRDAPFLAQQLEQENVQVLLLCGRGVLDQMIAIGMAQLEQVAEVRNAAGTVRCTVFAGTAGGAAAYGWSSNLQSQQGVDGHLKQQLAQALGELRRHGRGDAVGGGIDEGTEVSSKAELGELLRIWHRTTNEPTIGDVAQYGGRAYIRINLHDVQVVLNADTKRAAVGRYLAAVDAHGADLPWQVMQGRSKVNKVVYEGMETAAGWYAYTTRELEAPRCL